jgi:hypothetical protein
MGDDNKYAGDESGGETAATPENKYAGDKSGGDKSGTDSGATTDSSGDSTSDPDSGISPANKYAG